MCKKKGGLEPNLTKKIGQIGQIGQIGSAVYLLNGIRILIFTIVLGAKYSLYVKSIATLKYGTNKHARLSNT
jgi:hypothetical protein